MFKDAESSSRAQEVSEELGCVEEIRNWFGNVTQEGGEFGCEVMNCVCHGSVQKYARSWYKVISILGKIWGTIIVNKVRKLPSRQ